MRDERGHARGGVVLSMCQQVTKLGFGGGFSSASAPSIHCVVEAHPSRGAFRTLACCISFDVPKAERAMGCLHILCAGIKTSQPTRIWLYKVKRT